nr:hypothetical protein CFP56_59245 [Quercus suber]
MLGQLCLNAEVIGKLKEIGKLERVRRSCSWMLGHSRALMITVRSGGNWTVDVLVESDACALICFHDCA